MDNAQGKKRIGMKNIGEMFGLTNRGDSHRLTPHDGIMLSVQGAGGDRRALSISIGVKLMEACRWVTGDRITIDFDAAKSEATLRRVLPTDKRVVSWGLSNRSGEKGAEKGQIAAATVKISSTPLMLKAFGMDDCEGAYVPSPILTGPHGVTFPLRKQWTVQRATT
jgi:hypothetical protein